MFRHRKSFVFLALMLIVVVIGGGLLHSLVPHSHGVGDDHSGKGETIIWQIFHSALKHDDKKALFAQLEPLLLILLSIIASNQLREDSILFTREFSDPRVHDERMSALRRGVFKYRVFG